jgi:hypothetical protein
MSTWKRFLAYFNKGDTVEHTLLKEIVNWNWELTLSEASDDLRRSEEVYYSQIVRFDKPHFAIKSSQEST